MIKKKEGPVGGIGTMNAMCSGNSGGEWLLEAFGVLEGPSGGQTFSSLEPPWLLSQHVHTYKVKRGLDPIGGRLGHLFP